MIVLLPAGLVLFVFFVFYARSHFSKICDDSMEPILKKGERVLYRPVDIRAEDPVIYRKNGRLHVGQAAALPGETIRIVRGELTAGGRAIRPLAGSFPCFVFVSSEPAEATYTVPEQCWFVLPGNVSPSILLPGGERLQAWFREATVSREQMGGRITRVLTPVSRRRRLR